MKNLASENKVLLRKQHYAVETATPRKIVAKQYDYQLYPKSMTELLSKTGAANLKIIPIGDFDVEGDFWMIPFEKIKELLIPENLTKGLTKKGKVRARRWRFHMENHFFVLFPGNRTHLGEIDMREFYGANGAKLPIVNSN
jgi:hypothetical protein